METKPLLYGIIGFILGGLLVSIVATNQDKYDDKKSRIDSTSEHNQTAASNLKSLKGDDFDRAFIDEMILHHQGAIDMAQLINANAKHAELKQLGQDIISAQSREIKMMRDWQINWGYVQDAQQDMPDNMH